MVVHVGPLALPLLGEKNVQIVKSRRADARKYLLQHRFNIHDHRRSHRLHVLPDLHANPEITSLLIVSAATASALSLAALRTAANFNIWGPFIDNNDSTQDAAAAAAAASASTTSESPPPASVDEIWTKAWSGLDSNPSSAIPNPSSTTQEEESSQVLSALTTTPMLWIQGLRGGSRKQLLALSLAALETSLKRSSESNKTNYSSSSSSSTGRWSEARTAEILYQSSREAAEAWLGYLPAALQCSSSSSSSSIENRENREDDKEEEGSRVQWYAIDERLGVYSSVLRLLQSYSIINSSNEDVAAAEKEQQQQLNFNSSSTTKVENEKVAMTAVQDVRLSATAALQINNNRTSSTTGISGWRATQSGARSHSQLLSLAPSVLQDMAVRVADAVAAAYLAEAAQGTWTPDNLSTQAVNAARKETENEVGIVQTVQTVQPSNSSSSSSSSSSSLEASWWPVFAHPRLASTRQLQRFSNRLLAARWMNELFHSVIAMYADRLPLFTLHAPGGVIRVRQAPVRRASQLSRLTGVRYGVSLALEAVDVVAPTLRALWSKAAAVVAWVLTFGIGKSIGLVWRGLRMGVMGGAAVEKKVKKDRNNVGKKQENRGGGENGGDLRLAFDT